MGEVPLPPRFDDALQQSEHRLRIASEAARLGVFEWHVESDTAYWENDRMYEIFGRTREDGPLSLAEFYADTIDSRDRLDFDRALTEASQSNGAVHAVCRVRRRNDGEQRWIELSGSFDRAADGAPQRLVGVIADITERKRAEDALRESREDLDRAQEVGQIGSWRLDVRHNVLTWSDENHRIFGVPRGAKLTYETFLEIVHPDDRGYVDAQWQAGLRGEPYDIEHRILVDDQVKWVREKAFLELDGAGNLLGGFGITQDITERKRTEQALRESESFHRQILESIPGMVFTTRPDGYCDYQSQQWVDYTGVPLSEHLGDGWNKLLHPDDQPRAMAAWRSAVDGRAPYDLEYRVRRRDGAFEWFKVIGRPIRDRSGNIVRWFGVALNIEELKRADEAVQSSLREKEILLREIHHRVKNNLQVISSLVSLQANSVGNPDLNWVFEDVRDRVRTMALVHEELYQSENLAEVALDSYVTNLLHSLWRAHGDAAARVKLELLLEPITLSVEQAVPCGLILNELASNALKHAFPGGEKGEVTVAVQAPADGGVRLTIRDNGVGLPADLDWRRTSTLGLRLVQLLGQQLKATLDVGNDAGTTVTLRF